MKNDLKTLADTMHLTKKKNSKSTTVPLKIESYGQYTTLILIKQVGTMAYFPPYCRKQVIYLLSLYKLYFDLVWNWATFPKYGEKH